MTACRVCGAPCRPPFRAPTAEQAPDLDGRPGEPARSSLKRWIATCRGCGASAPDLAALPEQARAVVRSAEYVALRRAGPFERWAMIAERTGNPAEAGDALLQAAWAAEDAGQDGAALRRRAVALWPKGTDAGAVLRELDVLRRAGDGPAALARAAALDGMALDENSSALLRFERERIAEGDTGRCMISSVLRPPAHRPHATLGRASGTGFWARMLGR